MRILTVTWIHKKITCRIATFLKLCKLFFLPPLQRQLAPALQLCPGKEAAKSVTQIIYLGPLPIRMYLQWNQEYKFPINSILTTCSNRRKDAVLQAFGQRQLEFLRQRHVREYATLLPSSRWEKSADSNKAYSHKALESEQLNPQKLAMHSWIICLHVWRNRNTNCCSRGYFLHTFSSCCSSVNWNLTHSRIFFSSCRGTLPQGSDFNSARLARIKVYTP